MITRREFAGALTAVGTIAWRIAEPAGAAGATGSSPAFELRPLPRSIRCLLTREALLASFSQKALYHRCQAWISSEWQRFFPEALRTADIVERLEPEDKAERFCTPRFVVDIDDLMVLERQSYYADRFIEPLRDLALEVNRQKQQHAGKILLIEQPYVHFKREAWNFEWFFYATVVQARKH